MARYVTGKQLVSCVTSLTSIVMNASAVYLGRYIHVIGDIDFFLVWVLWDTQTDKENASILPMLWLNLFEIMDIMLNFITSVSFLMCNTYNTFVYINFV